MGKFIIKKVPTGYNFKLLATNGQTIASSEIYLTGASCKKGIESVKRCALVAGVDDLTLEVRDAVKHPKFELFEDKAGEFRFRLKARNGEIIAVSEGYKKKASCENGIDSVKKNAPDADVEFE